MHAIIKALIGFVFIVAGLGLFINSVSPVVPILGDFWITNFIILVTGVIPIFLILLGLFIVWLEIDELKREKEMKSKK
jgi:cell division protein FtsX